MGFCFSKSSLENVKSGEGGGTGFWGVALEWLWLS